MLKYNASHEIPLPLDLNRILKSYLKVTFRCETMFSN